MIKFNFKYFTFKLKILKIALKVLLILAINSFTLNYLFADLNKFFPNSNLNNSNINRFSLKDSTSFFAGTFVTPNSFGADELNLLGVDIETKIFDNISSGLKISGLNNNLYNEYKISSGLAYDFEKFFLNATIEYNNLKIKNYNSSSFYSLSLAGEIDFDDRSKAGFTLNNINNGRFSDSSITNNNFLMVYLNYLVINNISFQIAYFQEFSKLTSVNFGLEYNFYQYIDFYLAYNLNPKIICFAANIKPIKSFGLTINYYYHSILGLEQSYGLSYNY